MTKPLPVEKHVEKHIGEMHTYKLQVLEAHLDSFGHMNNATYLQILEEARWDLITSRGYGYDKIHETKIGPTILEINLQFKKEIRLREIITIETRVKDYSKVVGNLVQEVKGPDGDMRCIAHFKIGLFDMNKRKLIAATPEWLHAVGIG